MRKNLRLASILGLSVVWVALSSTAWGGTEVVFDTGTSIVLLNELDYQEDSLVINAGEVTVSTTNGTTDFNPASITLNGGSLLLGVDNTGAAIGDAGVSVTLYPDITDTGTLGDFVMGKADGTGSATLVIGNGYELYANQVTVNSGAVKLGDAANGTGYLSADGGILFTGKGTTTLDLDVTSTMTAMGNIVFGAENGTGKTITSTLAASGNDFSRVMANGDLILNKNAVVQGDGLLSAGGSIVMNEGSMLIAGNGTWTTTGEVAGIEDPGKGLVVAGPHFINNGGDIIVGSAATPNASLYYNGGFEMKGGTVTIANGGRFTVLPEIFFNDGVISVGAGSSLKVEAGTSTPEAVYIGDVDQTTGKKIAGANPILAINGGTVDFSGVGAVIDHNGTVTGSGTFNVADKGVQVRNGGSIGTNGTGNLDVYIGSGSMIVESGGSIVTDGSASKVNVSGITGSSLNIKDGAIIKVGTGFQAGDTVIGTSGVSTVSLASGAKVQNSIYGSNTFDTDAHGNVIIKNSTAKSSAMTGFTNQLASNGVYLSRMLTNSQVFENTLALDTIINPGNNRINTADPVAVRNARVLLGLVGGTNSAIDYDGNFSEYRTASGAFNTSGYRSDWAAVVGYDNAMAVNSGFSTNRLVMGQLGAYTSAVQNDFNQARAMVESDGGFASVRQMDCGSSFSLGGKGRFFAGGIGFWEQYDDRSGLPGYDYDAYGVIAGYAHSFGGLTIGGSFAYTRADIDENHAIDDNKIDTYTAALHAKYKHQSGFFGTLFGAYTYGDNEFRKFMTGPAAWTRSDYHTDTWMLGFNLGYEFKPVSGLAIIPAVGLTYQHARNSSHMSTLAGTAFQNFDRAKNHATTLPVELAVEYTIPTGTNSGFSIGANGGYSYQFNNDGTEGNFSVAGVPGFMSVVDSKPGRHMWNVGAKVKYKFQNFEIGAKYDYYAKSDYDAHRLMATVGISF